MRDVDAGGSVGGARTAGDEADPGPAGGLAHRFRHDGGAAFLAAHRDGKIAIMECVENSEVALAGHAESMAYAVDDQLVDEHFRSRAHIVLGNHLKLPGLPPPYPPPQAGEGRVGAVAAPPL